MNDLPENAVETYPLRAEQSLASAAELGDYQEMQAELAPGESVQFSFVVCLAGASGSVVTFTLLTPANPNGGFQIAGSGAAAFAQTSYGADSFNAAVGSQRGGVPGTLEGYDVHVVSGNLANGHQPGLLKLEVSGASGLRAMPGSHLEVRRIGNSRDNEVGA